MDRRRFCTVALGGVLGGFAGCSRTGSPGDARATDGSTTETDPTTGTDEAVSLAETGQPADICESEIIEDFGIKAIVDPSFGSNWSEYDIDRKYRRDEADEGLAGDAAVVGLEHAGRTRAFPLSVLWHHEIVNDTFGVPLAVTYCSICRSGLVADRRIRDEPTLFRVSGQLWHPPDRAISASEEAGRAFGTGRWNAAEQTNVRDGANLVMYDDLTGSFWSQALGQAICGPMTGTSLSIVPSTLAPWSEWRRAHPETEVLLPPPHSTVDA